MGGQYLYILEATILSHHADKTLSFGKGLRKEVCDEACLHWDDCYVVKFPMGLISDLKASKDLSKTLTLPQNFILRFSKFGDFSILDDSLRSLVLDLIKLSGDRLTYSNVWRGDDEPHFLYSPLFLASVSSRDDLLEATSKGYNVYASYSAGAKDMKELGLKFSTCLTLGDGLDMMYDHKLCSLCTHKCNGLQNIWSAPKDMVMKIRAAKDVLRAKK
jgi:hypothetical protein